MLPDPPETICGFTFSTGDPEMCGLELHYVGGRDVMLGLRIDDLDDLERQVTESILRCADAVGRVQQAWLPRLIRSEQPTGEPELMLGLRVAAFECFEHSGGACVVIRFVHPNGEFNDALMLATEAQKFVSKLRSVRAAIADASS